MIQCAGVKGSIRRAHSVQVTVGKNHRVIHTGPHDLSEQTGEASETKFQGPARPAGPAGRCRTASGTVLVTGPG
eukprot:752535-Hanusia_phi.AAC.2